MIMQLRTWWIDTVSYEILFHMWLGSMLWLGGVALFADPIAVGLTVIAGAVLKEALDKTTTGKFSVTDIAVTMGGGLAAHLVFIIGRFIRYVAG